MKVLVGILLGVSSFLVVLPVHAMPSLRPVVRDLHQPHQHKSWSHPQTPDHHPKNAHHGHHPNYHFAAGVKVGDVVLLKPKTQAVAVSNMLDVAVFFEWSVLPHRMELEFEAKGIWESHGFALPLEFLLKFPISLRSNLDLYLATGPEITFLLSVSDEHQHHGEVTYKAPSLLGMGWSSVVGFNWWFQSQMGFEFELNYTLFRDVQGQNWAHEIGLNAGVIVRW